MHKIPKGFLKGWLSGRVQLSDGVLRSIEKEKPGTMHRLMCRVSMVSLNCPNPWMVMTDWEHNMFDRSKKVGDVVVVMSGKHEVNWGKTGWFTLKPEHTGSPGELAAHRYRFVEFCMGGLKVAPPKNNYRQL